MPINSIFNVLDVKLCKTMPRNSAAVPGLVDRAEPTDEAQIGHREDIQRLYIWTKCLSIGFYRRPHSDSQQNDAVVGIS
jgi:hypothetical protein